MLALPVATSYAGFVPSLATMCLCWVFMTVTGLLILEANLWIKGKDVHFITMASKLLGPAGKATAWIVYLFIGYASLIAYTKGGGELTILAAKLSAGVPLSSLAAYTLFAAVFGYIIYLGADVVGRVNAILVGAMVLAYAGLVSVGIDEVQSSLLARKDWSRSLVAVPILLTVFSFQSIVPSLTLYLKRNLKHIRLAIVGGTTGALLVYVVWQVLVLGVVPLEGENGLAAALGQDALATESLRAVVKNGWISTFAEFFSFFALVTSFLGIALGLFDFLADGLKIPKKGVGKLSLALLVVVPSVFCALTVPQAFQLMMNVSGGFGDAVLSGILPALMVWAGRYHHKLQSEWTVPGGRILLVFVLTFSVGVLILEILEQTGHVSFLPDLR